MGRVAQSAADRLAVLWGRREAGELTREEFIASAVAVLGVSRARAVALADLGAAADMTRARGEVVAPLGLLPPATAVVLPALVALDSRGAAEVEGRAQTLTAAQDAHHEALQAHGAQGWTRVLNEGACVLCRDLAGDVLPISATPYHHKGCGCSTRPVNTTQEESP